MIETSYVRGVGKSLFIPSIISVLFLNRIVLDVKTCLLVGPICYMKRLTMSTLLFVFALISPKMLRKQMKVRFVYR